MYTYIVYGDYMQSTIRVDEEIIEILDQIKSKEKLKSHNEVIRNLIKKREISMFGADKKLSRWDEKNDRARFR